MNEGDAGEQIKRHYRDLTERLERALLDTVDRALRNCPSGRPLKHALFGAVRQMLIENHRDISLAAIGNPELPPDQKHRINDFNSAVYMYMYALCELAMDGNTLWSDPDLLAEQYKHRLRRAVSNSAGLDVKTGKHVYDPGKKG